MSRKSLFAAVRQCPLVAEHRHDRRGSNPKKTRLWEVNKSESGFLFKKWIKIYLYLQKKKKDVE